MASACLMISFWIIQYLHYVVLSDPPPPPIWPDAFTVASREHWYEYVNNTKVPIGINDAVWYYDYSNKRMRFDHMEGQVDNFCFANVQKPIYCQLIFDPSGVLFVNYPTIDKCCTLCKVGEFCTVLKPTWIANGTFNGTKTFKDGRTCNVWNENGFVAEDYWGQDEDNVPCAYYEDVHDSGYHFWHELDFNASSYIIGEPNPNIFDVPNDCHQICNKTY